MGRMYDILNRFNGQPRAEQPEPETEPAGDAAPFVEVGDGVWETSIPAPGAEVATLPFPARGGDRRVFAISFRSIEPAAAAAGGEIDPALIALLDPNHAVAGQYRRLMYELMDQVADRPKPVMAFTGPEAEQRRLVGLNLAVTLARVGGLRVAVVESRSDEFSLCGALGVNAPRGWVGVLESGGAVAAAVTPTPVENLALVPAGAGGPAVLSPQAVLEPLREEFDWLLIDADADPASAGLVRPGLLDGLYVVARSETADTDATAKLVAALERQQLPLRGMVVTHEE